MSDKPNNTPVNTNNGAVPQHHRMAEGRPVTGQTTPAAPASSVPRIPA